MTITPPRILPKNSWMKHLFDDYTEGVRLSREDALRLLLLEDESDQRALWAFANAVRQKYVGDVV